MRDRKLARKVSKIKSHHLHLSGRETREAISNNFVTKDRENCIVFLVQECGKKHYKIIINKFSCSDWENRPKTRYFGTVVPSDTDHIARVEAVVCKNYFRRRNVKRGIERMVSHGNFDRVTDFNQVYITSDWLDYEKFHRMNFGFESKKPIDVFFTKFERES